MAGSGKHTHGPVRRWLDLLYDILSDRMLLLVFLLPFALLGRVLFDAAGWNRGGLGIQDLVMLAAGLLGLWGLWRCFHRS